MSGIADQIETAIEKAAARAFAAQVGELLKVLQQQPTGLRTLRAEQVREKLGGMSRASFDRLWKDRSKAFPRPKRLCGLQWIEAEIDDWVLRHPDAI